MFDGTRIDQQFATWPSHPHNPQPRVACEPVAGCVEHSLHELHAPENLDEELLGKNERTNAIDDDRFEIRWLFRHATMRSCFSLSLKASESCASAPSDRTTASNQARRLSARAPSEKTPVLKSVTKKCYSDPIPFFRFACKCPILIHLKWCAVQVSNLRPLPCQGSALPLS